MLINIEKIHIHPLKSLSDTQVQTDILRLDLIHPVISGNKWFKLKYYLEEAKKEHAECVASFGGAYSNHIVALACAAKEKGFKSVGIIRGDECTLLSHTLLEAQAYGMQFIFVDREAYRNKETITQQYHQPGWYWIPEGGYGALGTKGAADILKLCDTASYTHILCATGTGTMMSGLVQSALFHQKIIGISVLKNHLSLEEEIKALLPDNAHASFECIHGYHFGGYAKHPESLLAYMRELWQLDALPTDMVYTAKLCYAAKDLIVKKQFPVNSKLLLIHSGGLQGNRSLPQGTLPFIQGSE